MPMIDIQEVGTGGGSIARVEVGNALRVGPESAGAVPGPACYGRGGREPTVTDANLLLGRLGADRFLGGEMMLDVTAALNALTERVAKPLGLDPIEAAEGILRIATTKMAHVVRWVTTERGLDAADFALVAYGGAGPLHAAMVARELAHRQGRHPARARALLGLRHAGGGSPPRLRHHLVHAARRTPRSPTWKRCSPTMEARGRETVTRHQGGAATTAVRGADMRYVGQEHAVTVDLPLELFRSQDRDGIKRRFDAVHQVRYGFSVEQEKAEIVSLRSATIGVDAQAAVRAHRRRAAPHPTPRASAAPARSTSRAPASWRRRPTTGSP